MRIRRCAVLMVEPRERFDFDLRSLSHGGTGLSSTHQWFARAPHIDAEIVLTGEEVAVLGAISPSVWTHLDEVVLTQSRETVESLLEKNLLLGEATDADGRDQLLRAAHWRPAAALMHYASRWHEVDTEAAIHHFTENFDGDLLDRLGPAPAAVLERVDAAQRMALPAVDATALDLLLDRRVTCRNFDPSLQMTTAQFASVMYRTFGARVVDDYAPGVQILKKGVPSAGGLHPTEAYLLVQHVEGVAPGLYHYHPVEHALEPICSLRADEAAVLAGRFVANQAYFVDAHVLVFPTSRFRRQSWKYRNHAKAYRALILDVGHLSQTMYLAATELGLGAFITAAVNEVDIEEAFGLDPLEEGPLAVCGFGIRGPERNEVEFDPLNAVWSEQENARVAQDRDRQIARASMRCDTTGASGVSGAESSAARGRVDCRS